MAEAKDKQQQQQQAQQQQGQQQGATKKTQQPGIVTGETGVEQRSNPQQGDQDAPPGTIEHLGSDRPYEGASVVEKESGD